MAPIALDMAPLDPEQNRSDVGRENPASRDDTILSSRELTTMLEYAEGEAWGDMQRGASGEYARRTGIEVHYIGGVIALVAPGVPTMLFNRVIGLGLREPVTPAVIDTLVAIYRNAGSKRMAIQPSPFILTQEVDRWLCERGFRRRNNWSKVYRIPSDDVSIDTDLRIASVDPTERDLFGDVACEGFGVSLAMSSGLQSTVGRLGWYQFMAWDKDDPVACGALFVRDRIGWLGLGATLPSHRRRGAQGAIMAARIRLASELGCRWVVTETGEDRPNAPTNSSLHNMIRTGFRLAYQRPNYELSL